MLAAGPRLTRHEVPRLAHAWGEQLRGSGALELDLGALVEIDSAGVAFLAACRRRADRDRRALQLTGLRPEIAARLELFPFVDAPPAATAGPGWLERLGEQVDGWRGWLIDYLLLCADVAWFTVSGLWRRRGIRWRIVAYEMSNMGSQALGVVGLISFLVGGTIALQSAAQLRQFGANIFVVDLIGVSLTRELGPLIAAIVVAGRSGSAVAAELATMQITEEVDALRAMGLHPTRFLVVPKVLAITFTQPVVTVMANLLGLFGGFLVAVTYLDVGPSPFLGRLEQALFVRDLLIGLFKSVLFAQLIVTVSALCGLRTRGGADAVGRSTTLSVVASIFAVIVADALCSMVFYFQGA